MRLLLLLLCSIIALFGLDVDAVVQKAKAQNKKVLIELTSPRCHYCKIMDRTLEDKEVQKALQRFYFVKVDVTKDSIPLYLFPDMTPTFIFLSLDGKIVKKVPGAWSKEDFLKILSEVK